MIPSAVVIGSGFGGLAAAIRLQARGYRVTLVERLSEPGGRAYRLKDKGYTFDMGPSLLTAPSLLQELFQLAGTRLEDELETVHLYPYYRVFFHDKSYIDYSGDPERMKAQMGKFDRADAKAYDRFMGAITPIYEEIMEKGLGAKPFDSLWKMIRFVPTVLRLKAFLSAHTFVKLFFRNWRHRFIFSFHPLYIGGNPFTAPAIYLMIPYLERKEGVWYSKGGMHEVILALARAFEKMGGKIVFDAPAEKIEIFEGRARAVLTPKGRFQADLVVSNADVAFTYQKLIDSRWRRKWKDRKIAALQPTMSCFLIFAGVRKSYPQLTHHTLILSKRYKGLVEDIFKHRILSEDFSLYLHAPSKTEPQMAPEGCESLFILCPVPNMRSGLDWETIKEEFAQSILSYLEEWGLKDLRANLDCLHLFTPIDFSRRLNAFQGNAFGLEPKLSQTGFFRPHNRSEDIPNLYFAGAGTHPGAGVPGVLLSAKAMEHCVISDSGQYWRT